MLSSTLHGIRQATLVANLKQQRQICTAQSKQNKSEFSINSDLAEKSSLDSKHARANPMDEPLHG